MTDIREQGNGTQGHSPAVPSPGTVAPHGVPALRQSIPVQAGNTEGIQHGNAAGTAGSTAPHVPSPAPTGGPTRSRFRRWRGDGSPEGKPTSRGRRRPSPRPRRKIGNTEIDVPRGRAIVVWTLVGLALVAVIAAPIVLSSQDLYSWARAPRGLNLGDPWAHFVYLGLDLAAVVCIGMTLIAAWRGERIMAFALLVWAFAGTSAYAQHTHGIAERDAGRAQDAWWAMPGFALLGPLLLEVFLHTMRRWVLKDAGQHTSPLRILMSPWESASAWRASIKEGIDFAAGVDFVRDRRAVKGLPAVEAISYAATAIPSTDPYEIRRWLSDRGVKVSWVELEEVAGFPLRPVLEVPLPADDDPAGEFPGDVPALAAPTPGGLPGYPGAVPTIPVPTSPAPAGRHTAPTGNAGGRHVAAGGAGNGGGNGDGTGDDPALSPLYERHRERLIKVKANLRGAAGGDWTVMPEAEITMDAVKVAGGFGKNEYASQVRRLILADRRTTRADVAAAVATF